MAPNPSAALRVVLAALIAAGPMPIPAFAEPKVATAEDVFVIKVGEAVPTYHAVMVFTKDVSEMKAGDAKDVQLLVPKQMRNLQRLEVWGVSIPYAFFHYGVEASAEPGKLKLIEGHNTKSGSRWQVYRGGNWIAGKDNVPATFQGCRPNGDGHCFSAIRGIPRKFTITLAETPPPQPVPGQPAPGQPAPGQPAPGQPDPAQPPAVAETLKDWSFVRTADGSFAVGKETLAGAKKKADECRAEGFVSVPLYSFKFDPDQPGKPLSATAENKGPLRVYKKGAPGQPMAWHPKDVDISAAECEATKCEGLTIERPADKATGALRPEHLDRPFTAKEGGAVLSGKTAVAPTPSEACSGQAPDPLAGDLKKLLGDDQAALTLAKLAQRVWKGEPSFAAVLADALKNPDAAKGKAAFLAKAREAVLAENGKPAIAALKADSALMADFNSHHCKKAATPPSQPVKTASDKKELKQIATEGIERVDTGGGAPAVAPASTQPLPETNPYAAICAIINDPGDVRQPGPGSGTGRVGDITNAGPITPDVPGKDTSAEDLKKKQNLQRMVIGGMGGAIVLGVFGFIFGGPIGALAMGAIGFGAMAGVTYLNNNPIDK